MVEQAIGEKLSGEPLDDPNAGKNPAAVALGKLGGAKGGAARAAAWCWWKKKKLRLRLFRNQTDPLPKFEILAGDSLNTPTSATGETSPLEKTFFSGRSTRTSSSIEPILSR